MFGLFSYVFRLLHSLETNETERAEISYLDPLPSRSGFVKERLYVGEAIVATMFGVAFS